VATIKSITAGKLLQEFLKGYEHDDPFGEQGLVIVKQLLDIAFPGKNLEGIIASKELLDLLSYAAAQYNFRKKPLFLAFSSFILEKSKKELKKMSGDQLKKELITLIADDTDQPLPSFELERSAYDLSGNPESAAVVRDSLERALISTTASLFEYILIGTENNSGKLFQVLDSNIRITADRLRKINPFCTLLKALLEYKWVNISLNGCLPTLTELGVNDVCKYVEENPKAYLEKIKYKILKKIESDMKFPLQSLINSSQVSAEKKDADFPLDLEIELVQYNKTTNKIIKGLKKIQSKLKSNKKVSSKDFDSLRETLNKDCIKIEKEISKEYLGFQKIIDGLFFHEPPWFKYTKKGSTWELISSQEVLRELNAKLTMKNAFEFEKKSKSLQKIIPIFEQLGGIRFAFENIIAHHFYDRVPSRLVKLVETPAKHQRIKVLRSLQEMRYSEGLNAVRTYLVQPSEILISNLLEIGLTYFKGSYMKGNPSVSIAEEELKNPRYLKLLDIPKELLEEQSPETFFGTEYFFFQLGEELVNFGFHLKSFNGKGNDLFGLLISSTAYENAQIYKNATRVLGNFSGYVYSTAIGNMKVCPPALKAVDDLFM
jgi:hypothetical protein